MTIAAMRWDLALLCQPTAVGTGKSDDERTISRNHAPATKCPYGADERADVLIPVGHQTTDCQRFQSDVSAEPFSQEHTRFLRCLWVSIEALRDLAAVEFRCARHDCECLAHRQTRTELRLDRRRRGGLGGLPCQRCQRRRRAAGRRDRARPRGLRPISAADRSRRICSSTQSRMRARSVSGRMSPSMKVTWSTQVAKKKRVNSASASSLRLPRPSRSLRLVWSQDARWPL
jgi:hypothetical protein